jgi:hypothetical protein
MLPATGKPGTPDIARHEQGHKHFGVARRAMAAGVQKGSADVE